MKQIWRTVACGSVLLLLTGMLSGCENGSDGAGSVGPDISGQWSGKYVSPSYSEVLTAYISEDGASVLIETTKTGVGHLLSGVIAENGDLRMTDQYDGETWTSYGAVTPSYVRIRDYLFNPSLGSDSPEQDIYLTR